MNLLNRSKKPLQLSLQNDAAQIQIGPLGASNGKKVNASLDMSHTDSTLWSSLDQTLQNTLAYPDQAALRTGEEENVFVFVPTVDLPMFPDAVLFTIKSHSVMPIVIQPQRIARAK